MKNRKSNLLLCLAFALGALCVAPGCASRSPENVAYNATASAITTADAAISAWSDYVVAERRRIKALKATDPGAALEAGNRLLVNEGRVSSAYYQYQDAAKAAVLIGASASNSTNSPAARIAAAAAPLIALVTQLTTR